MYVSFMQLTNSKGTDHEWNEFLEKLIVELSYFEQTETDLMRTIVKIESNVKPFPAYESFPKEADKAATLFYHRKTWYSLSFSIFLPSLLCSPASFSLVGMQ